MKTLFWNLGTIFSLIHLFFFSLSVHAQYHYEFTPAISVSEEYDDNIYLDPSNEISDYILAITPGINYSILSEKTDFSLTYSPSFVFYDDHTENDTTRHSASLTWGQDLTQHMRFDLTDTYYRGEEPLERDEAVQGVRNTREQYWRNTGNAGLEISFGPQNTLTLGYNHSYLKNEDPTIDDGNIQRPSAVLAYWFNTKNGVELNYEYTKIDYYLDEGVAVRDDFTGNVSGIRYIHQYRPQTSIFVEYGFSNRDFDGLTEDYDVHAGSVGFDHSFSPQTSLSLLGGFFSQDRDLAESQDGMVYNAFLTRRFERGSFTIGGSGGWHDSELDAEIRGFTRYNSGNLSIEYQLSEPFRFYIGGSYRVDRDKFSSEWSTLRGNMRIIWTFLQHFALELDYRYSDRDDDEDVFDYTSNRIMLTLRASKLHRW